MLKKILLIGFILTGILIAFLLANLVRGENVLMAGDADKKEVIMELNKEGLFDSVTLRYEWDD